MENIKYSDFFLNLKHIPPKEDKVARSALRKQEKDRCKGGVFVDGVFIPGWLYWHMNHWWIVDDIKDEFGNIIPYEYRASLRDNEWLRAEALEQCRTFIDPDGNVSMKGYVEVGLRQGGKDLLNKSILYTPTNEITIGECEVGQQIYDESGKLTTIIGKYPQGKKPVYKLTLVDGREVYCGLEHNWEVWDRQPGKNKYIVKTTKELLENYKRVRPSWKNRKNPYEYRYSIPNNQAVGYADKVLPIDPYVLGLWLGDGSNYDTKITNIDQEIIDYIYDYAEEIGLQVTNTGKITYSITSGIRGGHENNRNLFHSYLRDTNLYQNKHIPDIYKYSSIEQRMELLRGLMDSDGSCAKNGKIEFSSSIPSLAKDFYSLCRSLGINLSSTNKHTSYKKEDIKIECKDTTRFILYTDKPIFKLTRKLNNISRNPKYLDHTVIVDIQYVFDEETTCIRVDNDSHLFLTDNYTVTHNSTIESSFTAYNAILFKKSQNAVVSCSEQDLDNLKLRLNYGLDKLHPIIKIPKLTKDKRAKSILLGYKSSDGEDQIWSHILIRNIADGQNTEGPAGLSAKSFIMDEIGKAPFSQALEAAKPAFMSKYGWRAIPILVGTGGAFDKGDDAERIFYHPEANNFLGFKNEETGETTGFFMSGLFRTDCKEETNLAAYLIKEGKIPQGDYPELSKIPILVSNKEKALKKILEDRRLKAMDPDNTEYLKLIMYFPLTPKECFLSSSENFYSTEIAQQQKDNLEKQFPGLKVGMFVDLEEQQVETNSGSVQVLDVKIVHKPSNKLPISSYPVKDKESLDAPIVIFEHPIPNAPVGLYTGGVDPYVFDEVVSSDSIGVVAIYKRSLDLFSNSFQNRIVAYYAARPKSKDEWNKNARLLIEYYNSVYTLVENDEMSFINYMNSLNKGHYLMDTPEWLKAEVGFKGANSVRPKGVSRSSLAVRNLLRTNLKQEMEEVYTTVAIEGSDEPRKILGITKFNDPMFLEEIIKWNKDRNADREVAYSLAITAARKLDELGIKPDVKNDDPRFQMPVRYKLKDKSGRNMFKPMTFYPTKGRPMKIFK